MIIERQSRTYFAPDDATALQKDGTWSALAHASLLPIDIKRLQDDAMKLRGGLPLPDDATLLTWAKANHPSAQYAAQAAALDARAAAAWADYQAKMKAQGVALPDVAPQYGGL